MMKDRTKIHLSLVVLFVVGVLSWQALKAVLPTKNPTAIDSHREGELLDRLLDWEQDCLCGAQLGGKKIVVPGDGYSFTCARCGRLYAWAWLEPKVALIYDANDYCEKGKDPIVTMLKEIENLAETSVIVKEATPKRLIQFHGGPTAIDSPREGEQASWSQKCPCGRSLSCTPHNEKDYKYVCAGCGREYAFAWLEPDSNFVPSPTTYKGMLEEAEERLALDQDYIERLKERILKEIGCKHEHSTSCTVYHKGGGECDGGCNTCIDCGKKW